MASAFHSYRIRRGVLLPGGALRLAGMLTSLGCLVSSGCSDPQVEPKNCGTSRPAFSIRVSGPEPQLPADLSVTAVYGAGAETYRLGSPDPRSEVLFCSVSAPAHGSTDPNPWERLECELWTDSSVTLRVTSVSYAELEEELKPELDRCGVVTSEVELTLRTPEPEPEP